MSWDSLDFASVSIYTVGTALTMVLVYYGLRTLKLFKGNVAARGLGRTFRSALFSLESASSCSSSIHWNPWACWL